MGGILLVDDDEELRNLWEAYLSPFDYEIYHAVNGLEALYMARHHQPALVILDLMMPLAAGDLVLGFIRSTDELKKIPVLIISAHHDLPVLARQYEADGFLQKPVMVEDFRAMVSHLLGWNQ